MNKPIVTHKKELEILQILMSAKPEYVPGHKIYCVPIDGDFCKINGMTHTDMMPIIKALSSRGTIKLIQENDDVVFPCITIAEKAYSYLSDLQFEAEIKAQDRKIEIVHDWKITIFNTFGGAFAGLLTSIIFWLITK